MNVKKEKKAAEIKRKPRSGGINLLTISERISLSYKERKALIAKRQAEKDAQEETNSLFKKRGA